MILVLALVTATMQPAAPKVGDLITVTFQAPVKLEASRDYEVVRQSGNTVVVRTFEPKPFALQGTIGTTRFRNLQVPVASVLKQGDDLALAPLSAPRPPPQALAPLIAIALAALCAIAAWVAVWLRSRQKIAPVATPVFVHPDDRYRRALLALRANPSRLARWAALANETRAYLAATRPDLGSDLTTSQLLPRLREHEASIVREILLQGDLEKFSLRGAPPRDFEEIVTRALELAPPPRTEAAA